MLDRLLSKLSLSDPERGHRFQTHINIWPQRSKGTPRVSKEVGYFLAMRGESVEDVLKKPVVVVPAYDDTLPLTSYFVSTSHNTYLLGDQLWGRASCESYAHVLTNNAHCVEIDVWPGPESDSDSEEFVVTHGWTLTADLRFRDVCGAIRGALDSRTADSDDSDADSRGEEGGGWPVFVSLECHVEPEKQGALVRIMEECWGERLVRSVVEGVNGSVSPGELRGRIVMMIEYHPPEISSDSSSSDLDSDSQAQKPKISNELAALGIYALSMKPKKNWLQQEIENLHILINISESTLLSLLPHSLPDLIAHGQRHLRRVYPRGTRIMSDNLNPLVAWRAGSHFAALNWQDFDVGMQLNEALFAGSRGWVPKPEHLRGGRRVERRLGMALDIIGLSALRHPDGQEDFKARIRVYLYHENGDKDWKSKSIKCKSSASGAGADAMINESCVWAFDADELAFLRIVITEDDETLGLFCARIIHLQQGYRFIRLLDKEGKDTQANLLVDFIISDIN